MQIFEAPVIITLEKGKPVVDTNNEFLNKAERKNCLVLNPISFQLKKFFEAGDNLRRVINLMNDIKQSVFIQHFINGRVWNDIIKKYEHNDLMNYTIPLWLYADEFEVNDAQGSHNKIDSVCGFYFHSPCLPDDMLSKLSSILVAGIVRKNAIQQSGTDELIKHIILPFKNLEEEGIPFQLDGKAVTVRFSLCLFQGDNLGIHSLLSLSRGFNATYYCRFCRRHKSRLQTDCSVFDDALRTISNYNEDVLTNDHSLTGISGKSVFNELPSFHVITNTSVDAMHDIFSNGICMYGFTAALNYFIYEKKYFTLANLNTRKNIISQATLDTGLRRMPDIDSIYDSKTKCKTVKMRMSADEMRAFCHNFTFIVGPFIPVDDSVWEYCRILINMVDKILSKKFSLQDIESLKKIIFQHHTLYQSLFKLTLKPKHHFILHYPTVILESGPVSRMMCFRNEAKHQAFKEYAHVITSRNNVAYTLCMKSCLQFSYDVYNFESKSELECKFCKSTLISRPYHKQIKDLPFALHEQLEFTSNMNHKGYQFSVGHFVTSSTDHQTQLLEIEEFIKQNDTLYIVVRHWVTGDFNERFLASEAIERKNVLSIINFDCIDGPPFRIQEICNKFLYRNKCIYLH